MICLLLTLLITFVISESLLNDSNYDINNIEHHYHLFNKYIKDHQKNYNLTE